MIIQASCYFIFLQVVVVSTAMFFYFVVVDNVVETGLELRAKSEWLSIPTLEPSVCWPAVHFFGGQLTIEGDMVELKADQTKGAANLVNESNKHEDGTVIERRHIKTLDESLAAGGPGWNLRCNLCGSYGAKWINNQRPGWGSLALCPEHAAEMEAELSRHKAEMFRLQHINYEQDIPEPYHGPQVWD